MRFSVLKSFIAFACFCFLSVVVQASENTDTSRVIIDIDSPKFRPLRLVVPEILTVDAGLHSHARQATQELKRILKFSGYFQLIETKLRPDKQSILKGIKDTGSWKQLGAEAVVMGLLDKKSGGVEVLLRTVDLGTGKTVVGKKYQQVTDTVKAMRRYGDRLLTAYTGKPGIFSSQIVFVGKATRKSPKQIYISDFDGGNAKPITFTKSPVVAPTISPDGKTVLYTSYESGNPDLYKHDLRTRKKKRIMSYKGLNTSARYSPDGKLIALTGSVNGNSDIYLTGPEGGARKAFIVGPGLDVDPVFSPNGKWMAYVSGRHGNPHIFLATLKWSEGKQSVRVLGDKRLTYAGWYNASPAWTRDSSRIAFAGYDRDTGRFDIFLMGPDGSGLERLTIHSGDNESPSWSPNSQLIVFHSTRVGKTNRKGPAQLYIMNRDGGVQRKLQTGLYHAENPFWGPSLQ